MDSFHQKVLGEFSVATFRTLGNAETLQNLFSLENAAASGIELEVTRLLVYVDATAALTAVSPVLRLSRPDVLPTGGTALTKKKRDTGQSSSSSVVARGATASDGGAVTGIVANPEAAALWTAFFTRLHTAVGYVQPFAIDLLPWYSLLVRQNESLLVRLQAAVGTSNPATNHYILNCAWREYTEL